MTKDRAELRRVAEASIRQSQEERQDSPSAMLRAVRAVMMVDPTIGEGEAFAMVWSIWPAEKN